eukprot:246856-Pelagomonas_calceolata.AAC.4
MSTPTGVHASQSVREARQYLLLACHSRQKERKTKLLPPCLFALPVSGAEDARRTTPTQAKSYCALRVILGHLVAGKVAGVNLAINLCASKQ